MKNSAISVFGAILLCTLLAVPAAYSQEGAQTRITEEGMASWYGGEFQGRKTANGEIFDTNLMTAAHRTLPFNTTAIVTNLESGKSVKVRINDRGPFIAGRSIDLSKAAAEQLGLISSGTCRVRIEAELPPAAVKTLITPTTDNLGSSDQAVVFVGVKPLQVDGGLNPGLHTVQVATFGIAANAEKLITLLKQRGLNPEAENLYDTGKTRVVLRSIPEPGLSATLTELKSLGFDQVIVRPQ